jgi:hypothetical protein
MTNTPKALAAQRNKRRALVAAGLTTYGTPRRNYQWPELDGLTGRVRMNERIRLTKLRSERSKKNCGIAFVLEKKPVNHAQWREETKILLALIDSVAAGISEVFAELPPKAKVACVELGNNLARIRRGLS